VRCVNKVGLESEVTSQEFIASFLAPDSTGSEIRFDHQAVTKSGVNVQISTTHIIFAWTDFTDPVGIASYYYRIVDGSTHLINWQDAGLHNYATLEETTLKNDHVYTVEVRATNRRDIYSQAINSSILVLNIFPQLTGKHA